MAYVSAVRRENSEGCPLISQVSSAFHSPQLEDTLETFRREVELDRSADWANSALAKHASLTRERAGSFSSEDRTRSSSFSSFDKLVGTSAVCAPVIGHLQPALCLLLTFLFTDMIRNGPSRRFSKRKPSRLTGVEGPGRLYSRHSLLVLLSSQR